MPFIAAGRDGKKVQEVVDKIPGIETVEHDVAEVSHDVEALTELFSGASVVCNTVGPFIKLGPATVEAALAAGCHYLDTTGEQDWALDAQKRWGAGFADAGLLLSPGVAQMYTTGEIAANIALETVPGLDTLDILVLWKGFPTYASTQTIFTILKADWFHLLNNEYAAWDHRATRECVVPGQHATALTVPWGGTLHPVWFREDPRVSTCLVIGGVMDRAVMDGVVATTGMFEDQIRPPDAEGQEGAVRDRRGPAGVHAAPGEPARQHLHRLRARVRAARARARGRPRQLQLQADRSAAGLLRLLAAAAAAAACGLRVGLPSVRAPAAAGGAAQFRARAGTSRSSRPTPCGSPTFSTRGRRCTRDAPCLTLDGSRCPTPTSSTCPSRSAGHWRGRACPGRQGRDPVRQRPGRLRVRVRHRAPGRSGARSTRATRRPRTASC